MKKGIQRALMASALVVGVVGVAPPAMAGCTTQLVPAFTVGAAGRDLATTPRIWVSACGTTETPGVTFLPAITVERYGDESYGVYFDYPSVYGGADWTVGIEIDGSYREVRVPANPAISGGRICLLFVGFSYHNPGTCLAHIER
jgi:hypothetical protein